MKRKNQYSIQSIRRIKTQNNSRIQSLEITNSPKNSNKNTDEFRLPSIKDKSTSYDSGENLYMIHQQSLSRNQKQQKIREKSKSLGRSYNQKKIIQRTQKIFQSLCHPQKHSSQDLIFIQAKDVKLQQPNKNQAFQQIISLFQEMKKSKKTKDVHSLLNFIQELKVVNNLFYKIDDILTLILLKKGRVTEWEESTIIYSQNQPKNSIYIILWGQIKLKQIYRNKVKYLIPGDFLCEEVVLFNNQKKELFGDIGFTKGSYITLQTAKTLTKCGLLQISKNQYEQIKRRFIQNSEKDKVFLFERILTWSLSKKVKFRK